MIENEKQRDNINNKEYNLKTYIKLERVTMNIKEMY